MKLDLVFPCNQDMNKMTDTEKGKFCSQCDKEVIDFTTWEKDDILQYLSKNKSCGMFKNEQLDRIKNNSVVHIRPQKSFIKRMIASVSIVLFTLTACDDRSTTVRPSLNPKSDSKVRPSNYRRTLGAPLRPRIEEVEPIELVGDTIIPSPVVSGFVGGGEITAQFPQGEDAMLSFLAKTIQYPQYETENKIEGIVYASFSIEKDGSIENIKIERTVEGSECFDEEVIRVLGLMPTWKPGEMNGTPIQSFFTLPISFSL